MYDTKQKNKIKEFFIINKEKSISGPSLVEIFKEEIDKSTIYRRLSNLENSKFIRKTFNVNKNCYEYQYVEKCDNHLHLLCKNCGKTIHLECGIANEFLNHILSDHGFNIDKFCSVIYGTCKECEN